MRRVISIGFLLLYLMVYAEFHQLIKLPVFFSHLFEHQQRDDISLVDFIQLHYFSGEGVDNDSEKDQQLPFKGNECTEVAIPVALIPDGINDLNCKSSFISTSQFPSSVMGNSTSYQISVWQPPKA